MARLVDVLETEPPDIFLHPVVAALRGLAAGITSRTAAVVAAGLAHHSAQVLQRRADEAIPVADEARFLLAIAQHCGDGSSSRVTTLRPAAKASAAAALASGPAGHPAWPSCSCAPAARRRATAAWTASWRTGRGTRQRASRHQRPSHRARLIATYVCLID